MGGAKMKVAPVIMIMINGGMTTTTLVLELSPPLKWYTGMS